MFKIKRGPTQNASQTDSHEKAGSALESVRDRMLFTKNLETLGITRMFDTCRSARKIQYYCYPFYLF